MTVDDDAVEAAWKALAQADGNLGEAMPGTAYFNRFMALRFAVHEFVGMSRARISQLRRENERLKERISVLEEQVEGLKAESPHWKKG